MNKIGSAVLIAAPSLIDIVPTFSAVAQSAGMSMPPINVTNSGIPNGNATGDAVWGLTNCTVTQGSTKVTCPAPAKYTMPSSGTVDLIADDAGANRTPFIGTVGTAFTGLNNVLTLTLDTAPSLSNAGAIANHVDQVEVSPTNTGTGVAFGTAYTLDCSAPACTSGDGHVDTLVYASVLSPVDNTVRILTRGTTALRNTTCALIDGSQQGVAGNVTEFTGTIGSTGTLSGLSPTQTGTITQEFGSSTTISGATTYTDTLIGCGFATYPTISVEYQAIALKVSQQGIYQGAPPCGSPTALTPSAGDISATCTAATDTFPGTVSFGTDNTNALQAIIGSNSSSYVGGPPIPMNDASATGHPESVYFPAGNYLTRPLNQYTGTFGAGGQYLATGYGCFFGDEHYHSNIFVIPNTQGDVFAWLNSNANSSVPNLGNTQTFSDFRSGSAFDANQGGACFRNLTIIGNRLSTAQQNGLAFYGKTEWAYIDNIVIDFLNGSALVAGSSNKSSGGIGDFNESVVQNVRFEDDGVVPPPSISSAAIDIHSFGPTNGSNTLSFNNIRVFQPFGTGMWIHTGNTASTGVVGIRLNNLYIEGSGISSTTAGGDLLELGDPPSMMDSGIFTVVGRNVQLVNPPLGFAALHVTGSSATSASGIDIDGSITGGAPSLKQGVQSPGRGVQVDACAACSFKMGENTAADYGLAVRAPGSSGTIATPCTASMIGAPGIIYDGNGAEPAVGSNGSTTAGALTTCIDPAAAGSVLYPVRQFSAANGSVAPAAMPPPDLVAQATATTGTVLTFGSAGLLPINQSELNWTIIRSGPSAAFVDNWDSAANILSALNTSGYGTALAGQVYHLQVCNETPVTETIAPVDPMTRGTVSLSAGQCLPIAMTILNGGSAVAFAAGPE